MLRFFGLTQEYKLELHKSIFNMVTFGKGGWTWDAVYDLPVFIRNYYMKLLVDAIERENVAAKPTPSKQPRMPRQG